MDVQDDKFKAGAKQFLLQMPEVSICLVLKLYLRSNSLAILTHQLFAAREMRVKFGWWSRRAMA